MTTNVIEKNDLPDSAFAYIEPGGAKDAVGKTAPRALRHLPYKTAGGDVDLELLVKALNAVPETNLPRATQARVAAKLESVAKRHQKSDRVEKYITREDGKWQVRAESGRVLGTHDSKADAAAQLAAIEAGKHRKAKAGGAVEWPVMPRPGFRGSKPERLAGEKAPNQKSEDGSIDDALVEKAWTDEARAAALEARRRGAAASGRERDERHWYGGDRDPSYHRRMDFVRTVEDKYGGAVADQASAILGVATHRDRFQGTHGFKAKEPLGEQNSNALRLISGHAHKLGLNKLGDKIDRYLGTTKAAKEGDTPEWSDDAEAAQSEAEEHGFEEVLRTDAGLRMSHPVGGYIFVEPSGKWHHGGADGETAGSGHGAAALGVHLGKQPDDMGALPAEDVAQPENPGAPGEEQSGVPGVPGAKNPAAPKKPQDDEEFDKAYEDFKRQVKAAVGKAAGPGSRVQSLVFDKDRYRKADEARGWASDHGFEGKKVEASDAEWRVLQADPGQFDRMRTVELTEGVKAVVGFPKQTVKAVQRAFFLTASGRLAFKRADLAKAECEPVRETELGTIFKVSLPFVEKSGTVVKSLYFAASGGAAVYLPAYEDLSKHEWVHVFKAEEQRYTLTVVYPASRKGEERGDFHGDVMYESELEKSAWNFMDKGTGRVGLMHRPGTAGAGKVVESYIWRAPEWKMKDTGGSEQSVSPGDWVMGIVWSPEAWAAIKGGSITGVSLQGAASKVAVA
jgi:hypothetical protein